MEKKTLEVGDVIYATNYGHTSVFVISRVTPTRAYANYSATSEQAFSRQLGLSGPKSIPKSAWGPRYELETPELKARYERKILASKASSLMSTIRPHDMTTEQLQNLIEAIKPFAK